MNLKERVKKIREHREKKNKYWGLKGKWDSFIFSGKEVTPKEEQLYKELCDLKKDLDWDVYGDDE